MELSEALDLLRKELPNERADLHVALTELDQAIFPPAQPVVHIEKTYVHGSPDSVMLTWCDQGCILNDNGMCNPPGFDYVTVEFNATCVECKRRYEDA